MALILHMTLPYCYCSCLFCLYGHFVWFTYLNIPYEQRLIFRCVWFCKWKLFLTMFPDMNLTSWIIHTANITLSHIWMSHKPERYCEVCEHTSATVHSVLLCFFPPSRCSAVTFHLRLWKVTFVSSSSLHI